MRLDSGAPEDELWVDRPRERPRERPFDFRRAELAGGAPNDLNVVAVCSSSCDQLNAAMVPRGGS
jgi:hypothetical protein